MSSGLNVLFFNDCIALSTQKFHLCTVLYQVLLNFGFVLKTYTCFTIKRAFEWLLLAQLKMRACIFMVKLSVTVQTLVLELLQVVPKYSANIVFLIITNAVRAGFVLLKPLVDTVRASETLALGALLRIPHNASANIADKVLLDRLNQTLVRV